MDAEQIIAGAVIVIVLAGESGVAHVPDVVYLGPPQDVAVAHVSTHTHAANYVAVIAPRAIIFMKPATRT